MRLTLLATLLAVLSLPSAALDLPAAVRYALANSPSLASEREQRDIREAEHDNARAKFFPSLDVSATHGVQGSQTSSPTDPWVSQLGVKLSETLYDNGQSLTQYRLTGIRRDIASLALAQSRDMLCLEVAKQFRSLSLAHHLSEVRHQQTQLLGKQVGTVGDQYRQGLKMRKDFLRLKTQLQRAEIEARNAMNEIERSKIALKKTLGAPMESALEFEPEKAESNIPTIPAQPPAVESTYEYRVAKNELAQFPFEVDLAKRKYWPELGLTAGANYQVSGYLGGSRTDTHGWNVLLTLNYNLWDWGQRRREVEIASARSNIGDNTFRKASLEVAAEIKNLMLDLPRLEQNLRMATELVRAEEENYEAIRRDYAEGKVPYLDLVSTLSGLLDARVLRYTAYFELANSLSRHHYYSGDLYEALNL